MQNKSEVKVWMFLILFSISEVIWSKQFSITQSLPL